MAELIPVTDIPAGFDYPSEFIRTVDFGLISLEPWWILTGERLHFTLSGLRRRYLTQIYIPFAARQDNDDIACWTEVATEVVVVHDFASAGDEQQGRFPDFHAWLRRAVDDYIEWG
ncbi:MAG: hypothetical protein ACRDPW_01470, partial [Mycobacteriales bacterium]